MPKTLDLLLPATADLPAASNAGPDEIAGGSSPAESMRVLSFGADGDRYADWHRPLTIAYAGGGVELRVKWAVDGVDEGNVLWRAAFRRMNPGHDSKASHTYVYQSVVSGAPGAPGVLQYATIAFSAAQIDGVQGSELYLVRVERKRTDASDTLDAAALLYAIDMVEPGA